jgi:hypothetical protein
MDRLDEGIVFESDPFNEIPRFTREEICFRIILEIRSPEPREK